MESLQLNVNPEVSTVFNTYPEFARPKMMALRQLVLETAEELETITALEETLKWGEPSYLTKIGSTIRMDWKTKMPDQVAMYFKCTSKLVSTFREVYEDVFTFEGTRAIVFQLDEQIPEKELKRCIAAGLTYHKVKHLPMLGL